MKKNACAHTAPERALTGFWCTNEVNKAFDKGYTVDKIYELQHFRKKSTDLFLGYIDMFVEIKLRASHKSPADDVDAKLRQNANI